jgi:hypothetical protein|eukprot:COSAG06_NODE_284_length_18336_cov_5.847124_5_plen_56_part_00
MWIPIDRCVLHILLYYDAEEAILLWFADQSNAPTHIPEPYLCQPLRHLIVSDDDM